MKSENQQRKNQNSTTLLCICLEQTDTCACHRQNQNIVDNITKTRVAISVFSQFSNFIDNEDEISWIWIHSYWVSFRQLIKVNIIIVLVWLISMTQNGVTFKP